MSTYNGLWKVIFLDDEELDEEEDEDLLKLDEDDKKVDGWDLDNYPDETPDDWDF